MPTPVAFLLNRPLTTLIFPFNGAIGSRQGPSRMSAPEPLAHHCVGLPPQPMNRAANRFGHGAVPPADALAPHAGIDSSHGRAIVTPAPRRNIRRDVETRPPPDGSVDRSEWLLIGIA